MRYLSNTDVAELDKLVDDIIQNEIELYKARTEHYLSLMDRLKKYGIFIEKDLTGIKTQFWVQQFIPKRILNDDEQSFEDVAEAQNEELTIKNYRKKLEKEYVDLRYQIDEIGTFGRSELFRVIEIEDQFEALDKFEFENQNN